MLHCTIIMLALVGPLLWEKARNSLSGPGLCSAEWQMTRFRVLLLVVMALESITHIHLAWILYVRQSNNVNIWKLDLKALFMIYLNYMYIAERLLGKILWAAFLLFFVFFFLKLTSISTTSETQHSLCVDATYIKTLFAKLVRQSHLR